jgi:NAD+ synthase
MGETSLQVQKTIDQLTDWLQDQTRQAKAKGGVVGLSGGLDSAVVAGLLKRAFPNDSLAVVLPCHSMEIDVRLAYLTGESLIIKTLEVDLSPIYDQLIKATESIKGIESFVPSKLAQSNIKARLRMTTLYYLAQSLNYLVIGTSNLPEISIGYFTKHGDGGVDLLPLANMSKGQVRELAKALDVPKEVIERPPTAGLWDGQTDEEDIGLTYDDMDKYLLTGIATKEVKEKMDRMIYISEHKRRTPPKGPFPVE